MKRLFILVLLLTGGVLVVAAQQIPESALLGGANTVFDTSEEAFTNPLPLLSAEELERFEEGDELFEEEFLVETGLGPVLNATSCEGCHLEDGRGRPPAFTGETGTGLLIRLALNEQTINGSTLSDPTYGGQFQDIGAGSTAAEGTIEITYTEITGTYADGTPYTLYAPNYDLIGLQYGDLHNEVTMSPRLANQMIGLGLLEAIPEATLIALADPSDSNLDGISGRPNYVWDVINNRITIGRFGWKANQPNLIQQTAGAYNGDMGITSSLNPDQPCTENQADCLVVTAESIEVANDTDNNTNARPPRDGQRNPNRPPRDGQRNGRNNGGNVNNPVQTTTTAATIASDGVEITDEHVLLTAFYSSTLAVPAQRNPTDATVMRGQQLFTQANCSSCHVPELETGIHASIPALSNQTIRPYTDLLLHDMGDGLADGQIDFQATGSEWRTAPLWGIGLLDTVNGYAFYLHDGRARTLEEAVLWHGGEAEASRNAFINMSADDRNALIEFLRSL